MPNRKVCLGHSERGVRGNKIKRMLDSPQETPDENLRVLIKRGPKKEETSLKELEENYASKPEWKVIEGGGVLSVPVEEFRMINPPKPDREGKVRFEEKKGKGAGNQIEKYSIAQTIRNLNEMILEKYNNEKDKAKAQGKSNIASEENAHAVAKKLPEFTAVQKWLDNEAEIQLKKSLEQMMTKLDILLPQSQITIHTLACFADASAVELQAIFCPRCLESGTVSEEDLADLSLLQKKSQVPDKPDPATTSGKKNLLTLTARLLSHQSLLHIGYREVEDKEKLVTERHRYNLETVDGKLMQKELVVASPQQQQVITNFTASLTKRHLVLEGPAGTGKTLVALQVANNLIESARTTSEEGSSQSLLVVTAHYKNENDPIMKYLDASTGGEAHKLFKSYSDLLEEFGISYRPGDTDLLQLSEGLTKKYEGRQIVLLVDEITNKRLLSKLGEQSFPDSVRMILILNPIESKGSSLTLSDSFLHVTLTTPYRSTNAITRLTRFIAKCEGLVVPEEDFGSDVEGTKPILLDVGKDERKLEEALKHCRKYLGHNVTILYSYELPYDSIDSIVKMAKDQGKKEGGPSDCYVAESFYGWEAERVVAVTNGYDMMEMITRARTHLAVILVDDHGYGAVSTSFIKETREHFFQAESKGLIDIVHLSD